ncbi:diguanylate cyclase [Pseudomonas alloputida]|uniref:Diguanylate cyclase n=3 Tax=Pseudomonas TaxID=286 RepID=A0ABD6MTS7_9PSED|nr:diguanylate cyclase [Pseudomonas hunanensis]PKF23832.1 diguanylate cyclase [Pseudomonas hunanensis]PTV55754.1 diguanylate cyclase [Pseudomonas putida]QKL10408.1 diguanylate cyclase [Pseudomonas putida]TRZ63622.1 diguanylate cyclase [Pseudomonas alloputida]
MARSSWARACPANTGEAGAIHRAGFFAGKPVPTGIAQA